MKKVAFILIFVSLFLGGCRIDSMAIKANTVEEALENLQKEEQNRDFKLYGILNAGDDLAFVAFKGLMNDQDFWVAEVTKKNQYWAVTNCYLIMDSGIPNEVYHFENVDLGYELGFTRGEMADDNARFFEFEEEVEWKIWYKHL